MKIWTPSWKGAIITALLAANIVLIRIIEALYYNQGRHNAEQSRIRNELRRNSSGDYNQERHNAELSRIRKELCMNSSGGCLLCPPDCLLHGDHCYYYSDTERTWDQSRDHCKMMGADLLVIKDKERQEFIQRALRQRADMYWIGLQRDGDVWRWVDGEYYNGSLFLIKTTTSGRCVSVTGSRYYPRGCESTYRQICVKKAVPI